MSNKYLEKIASRTLIKHLRTGQDVMQVTTYVKKKKKKKTDTTGRKWNRGTVRKD